MKRRNFISNSTIAIAGLSLGSPANFKKGVKLSFSTLGCPDWSFEKIVEFAVEHKYQGLEIRGIQRELNLLKCSPFSNTLNIANTVKLMKDKNLSFVDLGSSAALHHHEPEKRKQNLDDAKRFIDLAAAINCPHIRVFPNDLPKDQDRNQTIDRIISGLRELGDYAKGTKVVVLLESHGEVVYTADLVRIMEGANHPNVGLIWDIVNMWSVTQEAPEAVYPQLKKYIRHTHIKDFRSVEKKHLYTLVGEGESPVMKAVDLLYKNNYKGYYGFEWEKLWHPEIQEPEVAFAHYSAMMRKHFA